MNTEHLTIHERRDLLRILTIRRAALEAENPALMHCSEGAHLELCERIAALKAEIDAPGSEAKEAA